MKMNKIEYENKSIDLSEFCVEKDMEICGIELPSQKIVVLAVYRAPSGNEDIFLQHMDETLEKIIKQYHL